MSPMPSAIRVAQLTVAEAHLRRQAVEDHPRDSAVRSGKLGNKAAAHDVSLGAVTAALGWSHANRVGADPERHRTRGQPEAGRGLHAPRRRRGREPGAVPRGHDVPVRGAAGSESPNRWTGRGPTGCGASRQAQASPSSPGMFVPADDGRVTNTLIASGPGVDAHYDKIYLYDAFGFTESRTVAPGHEPVVITVDGVARRAEPLLRHPLPRALRRAGAARRAAHHRARLLGLGTGQARAVDAAGPRPGAGHRRVSSPPSARPIRATRSPQRDRREWAAASSHPRWARSSRRRAPTRSCSSPISTRMPCSRCGTRSRCCVTAQTSPKFIGQNRGGD